MKLINVTPHRIDLIIEHHSIIIPPSGIIARCSVETAPQQPITSSFDGIDFDVPFSKSSLGDIVGLPAPQEGVLYISSVVVAQKCKEIGRNDVIVPEVLRDQSGNIYGCKGFYQP